MADVPEHARPMIVSHRVILEVLVSWRSNNIAELLTREIHGYESIQQMLERVGSLVRELSRLFQMAQPQYIQLRVFSKIEDPAEPRLIADVILVPDYSETRVTVYAYVISKREKLKRSLQEVIARAITEAGGQFLGLAQTCIKRISLGEAPCEAT